MRTGVRAALAVLAVTLAAPAGALGATFRPAGPEGGPVLLAAGGGRIFGEAQSGIALRDVHGWRRCTALPRALRLRGGDDDLPRLAVAADGAVWVVGRAGLATGGRDCATWRRVPAPGATLGIVALAGPTAPLIAIQRDKIRRSDDGGRTWQVSSRLEREPAGAVAGGQTIVIDPAEGSRACSSDGGRTWRPLSGGEFSNAQTAIGGDGTIWSVDLGEGALDVARACGAPRRTVAGGPPGQLVGADLAGRAVFVDDDTNRLSLIEPATLAMRAGPVLGPIVGGALQATVGGPLLVGTFSGPWTITDGVARRDATGFRESIDAPPVVVDGGRRLLSVPILGGDVVASNDRGERWTPVVTGRDSDLGSTLERIDDAVLALIGAPSDDGDGPPGDLLLTTDGGRTWQARSAATAGWTAGTIIDDPTSATAWSVTLFRRVYRTRDAGRTWERLPGGLAAAGTMAVRPGELVVVRRSGRAWQITRIGRTGRARTGAVSGLPRSCPHLDALVGGATGMLVASACGRIYRSRDGRAFRRDAGPAPTSRRVTSALVAERSGTRTWLGRADGVFVQAVPGARWRRLPGSPRGVTALALAADDLLVVSERGLEAVALR